MKRTKEINHVIFRKKSILLRLTPIALAVLGAIMLTGCGQEQEVTEDLTIYSSPEACAQINPDLAKECASAYERAMAEAETTAPKFASAADCEAEFGKEGCKSVSTEGQTYNSGGMWMPLLAGYMFGRMMGGGMGGNQYANKPLYSPQNGAGQGKYYDGSGKSFGNAVPGRKVSVNQSDLKPNRASTQTLKRGGFGQVVANQNAAAMKKTSTSSSRSPSSSRSFGG